MRSDLRLTCIEQYQASLKGVGLHSPHVDLITSTVEYFNYKIVQETSITLINIHVKYNISTPQIQNRTVPRGP
jgi:hypothetical protein